MKKLFKKIAFCLLLCPFYIACEQPNDIKKDSIQLVKKLTEKQVLEIAENYGLTNFDLNKNELLLYMTVEEVEKHFKEEAFALKSIDEQKLYYERVKNIKSFDDYLKVIKSLPTVQQLEINSKGGIEKYNQWVSEMKIKKLHIYINEKGVVYFCPSELDDNPKGVLSQGYKRVDIVND